MSQGWIPWEQDWPELPVETKKYVELKASQESNLVTNMTGKKIPFDRAVELMRRWPPGKMYRKGKWRCQTPYVGNVFWWRFAKRFSRAHGVAKVNVPPFTIPPDCEPRFMPYVDGSMRPRDVFRSMGASHADIDDVWLAANMPQRPSSEEVASEYDTRLDDLTKHDPSEWLLNYEQEKHEANELTWKHVDKVPLVQAASIRKAIEGSMLPWAHVLTLMKMAPIGLTMNGLHKEYHKPHVGCWQLWRMVDLIPAGCSLRITKAPSFCIPFDAEPRYVSAKGGMPAIDVMRDMGLDEHAIRVTGNPSFHAETHEAGHYRKELDFLSMKSLEF